MSIKVNSAVEKVAAVLKAEFDGAGENIRVELQELYRAQFVRKKV